MKIPKFLIDIIHTVIPDNVKYFDEYGISSKIDSMAKVRNKIYPVLSKKKLSK